jgi:hypothetical protein
MTLRRSPSGSLLPLSDLGSDDVENTSTVVGESLSQALDTLLARRVRYLDFDSTLSAVRGPTLSQTTGQYAFADAYPGFRGVMLLGGARLNAAESGGLVLLGAVSVEAIVQLNSAPIAWLCGVGGTFGALPADNTSYSLCTSTTGTSLNARAAWQRDGGTLVAFDTSPSPGAATLPPVHNLLSLGFSRSAAGIVQPYLNGRVLGPASAALALPNGGQNGVFSVGAQLGQTASGSFTIASAAVYGRVRSASEWLASYNRSVGAGLGTIASPTP